MVFERIKLIEVEGKSRPVPVEKQRERENAGERWALEAQEILSALAVEEAQTLKAMLSCRLSVSFWFSQTHKKRK